MQVEKISVDKMWNIIEGFGIKRELIDPYSKLSYGTIHDLYLTIKNSQYMQIEKR